MAIQIHLTGKTLQVFKFDIVSHAIYIVVNYVEKFLFSSKPSEPAEARVNNPPLLVRCKYLDIILSQ